jgi:hypothetical protein
MPLDAKVMTLGAFLESHPKLIVPNYQRTYKWEQDYVADLLQDILEGLHLKEKSQGQSCFLGSVVLSHDPKSGLTDLVDGQQRLTTLAILLRRLAIRCASDEVAARARRILGNPSQPAIQHKVTKGAMCDDRAAYREVALSDKPNTLLHGPNTSKTTAKLNNDWKKSLESHRIYKAQKPIDEAITEILNQLGNKETASGVLKRILDGIKLVIINTDERKEGMRVFASINASGTKLESWELVMSSFYSHGGDSGADRTFSFFEGPKHSLTTALADTKPEIADAAKNDFMRAHWIAHNGHISKDDLFDCYNDYLAANPKAHEPTINALEKSLRCYSAFTNYSYSFPGAGKLNFEFLHTLATLGAKLPRPALVATASLYDNPAELTEAMQRLAFVFEKIHMRWKICDLRTNTIDKPLAHIAKLISSGKLGTRPDELEASVYGKVNELISTGPTRQQLIAGFLARNMSKEIKLSKAIASRINFATQHPGKSGRKLDFTHTPNVIGGYTCEKGIKLFVSDYEIGINKYGFSNRQEFVELIDSLGNTFLAASGKIVPSIPMNGDYTIGTLTANELSERRKYLAEVAADIWHF